MNKKWIRVYELQCLVCGHSFDAKSQNEPTCGDSCWGKLVSISNAGIPIPGLIDRLHNKHAPWRNIVAEDDADKLNPSAR